MIFPLWRFWTYSPLGFVAAVVWNVCELIGVACPFAPTVFGWIIGAKGELVEGANTPPDDPIR